MSEDLKNSSKLRNRAVKIFHLLFALGIIAVLLLLGDISRLVKQIKSADPIYYITAASLFILTYIPAGLRWKLFCRRLDMDISYKNSIGVFTISTALNKLLPFNSGDIIRSRLMNNYISFSSHTAILGLVLIERIFDLIALLTIVSLAVILLGTGHQTILIGILLVTGIVGCFLTPFLMKEHQIDYITARLPDRISGYFRELMNSYLKMDLDTALNGLSLSLLRWGLDVLVFYALGLSLGLDISIGISAVVTSFLSLSNALPLTPGGIGTSEAVGIGLLTFFGLGYTDALSLIILQRTLGYIGSVSLGSIVYALNPDNRINIREIIG